MSGTRVRGGHNGGTVGGPGVGERCLEKGAVCHPALRTMGTAPAPTARSSFDHSCPAPNLPPRRGLPPRRRVTLQGRHAYRGNFRFSTRVTETCKGYRGPFERGYLPKHSSSNSVGSTLRGMREPVRRNLRSHWGSGGPPWGGRPPGGGAPLCPRKECLGRKPRKVRPEGQAQSNSTEHKDRAKHLPHESSDDGLPGGMIRNAVRMGTVKPKTTN